MSLLWQYLLHYKKLLFLALFLAAVNIIFSLLDPQIFRLLIDNYASRPGSYSQQQFVAGVGLLLLATVGVALVSRIAKNFQDYYVNVITRRLGTEMYADSVRHAFGLAYAVFEDQRSGELLRKLQKARDDSQAFIATTINLLFVTVVGTIFAIIYSFLVHWTIGLLFFLLIPSIGLVTYLISRRIKAAQGRIVRQTAELAGSTTETLRNVELVKSLGLEDQEIKRLNLVNEQILDLELYKVKLIRTLSFIQGTLVNALRSTMMLLMLWLIFTQAITMGEFFAILFYSFFIFSPLQELGTLVTQYQEAGASVEELSKILKLQAEAKPAEPLTLPALSAISFDHVSFAYQSSQLTSIADISFEIKAGETVAFVGPSGSGKSTIIKLLAGLYQPSQGKFLINQLDSRQIDVVSWRQRLGLVTQETQLFAGTLKENLLFVRPEASDQECLQVLAQAQASELLGHSGRGLETRIGEGGIKISGGERQRLAIARALLRRPDLLIFDEATSSLDSITEQAVTATIRQIEEANPNLMSILVAHRLSTVAHADRIYVLEKGRLIEQGSHQGLLKKGGLYAALWREQSGLVS